MRLHAMWLGKSQPLDAPRLCLRMIELTGGLQA